MYLYTVSEIELFYCTFPKLLTRKRCYSLLLIPAFILQIQNLVQFTQHNIVYKISQSTSVHFAAHVKQLCSETVRNGIHVHIQLIA
jgi:hypothetical protein